ncbi:phosphoglycerate kinase [Aquella oligotrophica]|uniref:Phosphoglycerate kinase n=1 Tax=Aquella oligotrophica TaxID=2067065 RepID=A0A2I7N466_9NEIS|nr:phosphoglycerate kinase [Aquella oligotrophica]AUR51221.1 phosphoglycerate kinase [Aquella oligotrophica]
MKFNKITDLNLAGKVVFIRTDMNVPLDDNGIITDDTRIKAGVNTIKYALENGAKVIVATHLGRPAEGNIRAEDSVAPVAVRLGKLLDCEIPVVDNWQQGVTFPATNKIIMLENVRCNVGEKKNNEELGKKYAALCDVFCYDAFATAHRAEASTNSVGLYAKEICAGLLMAKELEALSKAVSSPQKPVVAVVAGSKVSTKLTILDNLADKVDTLIVGGGILNTFLMANGKDVAGSLVEVDLVNEAKQVIDKMSARGASVPLPYDVVVAEKFAPDAKAVEKHLDDIKSGEMILDIGSSFANQLAEIIAEAGTIIWNGPVGVFEFDQFANGTKIVANAIADSKGFSLAGGGDTIAAINKFNLFDKISYVSTAGGALLEFLEGKELPAVKLLTSR